MWYVSRNGLIAQLITLAAVSSPLSGCQLQLARELSKEPLASGTPRVTITSPAELSWANAATSPSFAVSGTCSEEGRSVTVSGAGSGIATCTGGTWSANVDVSGAANGNIVLFADHSSAAAVAATQASRQFQKDALAPSTPSFLSPGTALTLGATTYDFAWSVSDSGGSGLPAADAHLVELFANGTCTGAPASSLNRTPATYTYSPLSDATTYSIRVTTRDTAGNASATACSPAVTVNLAAPTLALTHTNTSSATYALDDGLTVSIGNDAGAVKWCLSETQSTAPASGAVACTGGYGPSSGWHTIRPTALTLSPLTEGTRTLYLWIADAADNVNPAAVSDSIFADFNNPTWQGFTAPTAAVFQTASSYAFTWNAATDTAAGSGLHASEAYFVERFTNGTCAGAAASSGNQTGTSYNYTGLTAGTSYSIRVTAKDASGRTAPGYCSSPVTVTSSGFVWVGAGGDADWTTAANWAGGAVPGASDTAIFDGTCSSNCSPTISTVVSVGGISMTSAYTGTITQGEDITVGSAGWTQAAGSFTGSNNSAHDLVIQGSFAMTGGTFTAPRGRATVWINMSLTAGTFVHNTGEFQFGGCGAGEGPSNVAPDPGIALFNRIRLCKDTDTITLGNVTAYHDLDIVLTSNAEVTGGLHARRMITASGTGRVGSILISSGVAQTLTTVSTIEFGSVVMNKIGGTLTLSGTMTVTGNWTHLSSGVFGGTGLVRFTGDTSSAISAAAMSFYDVAFEKANDADVSITGTMTALRNVTIGNCATCTIDGGVLEVRGNLTVSGNGGGTTAVTMSGASPQVVSQSGGTMPGGTFTANGTNIALGSNLTLNSTGQDLVVAGGELDLEGNNLTVNDRIDHNAGRIYLRGSETVSRGSYNFLTGAWVYYNGTGTYTGLALGNSYSSLRFSGTGTYTLNASLSAEWLNITAGTLNGGGQVISVSSRWENYATFTHGNSTVVLGPTTHSEMLGSTTFYNLTKSVTAARNLHLEQGTTQTVTGTLTLQGAAGQLLSVLSASPGVTASISPTGTRTIAYLNVRDISNVSGTTIYAGTTSTDSGNNSDWLFVNEPAQPDIEVPIELLVSGVSSSSTAIHEPKQGSIALNTNDFTGSSVDYYFEIVATNSDAVARTVSFVDGANVVRASVSIPAGTTTPTLIRTTAPFSPATGLNGYVLRLPQTASAGQVTVTAARVLIRQTGAIMSRLCSPVVTGGGFHDDVYDSRPPSAALTTTSTTYDAAGDANRLFFIKDGTRYRGLAGTTPWSLEVYMDNLGTGRAAVFDASANMVAGSEVAVTDNGSFNYGVASWSDSAANFTNRGGFYVDIRMEAGSTSATLVKAYVCVKLDKLRRADVNYLISRNYYNQTGAHGFQRAFVNTSLFTNPLVYFSTYMDPNGAPRSSQLMDDGSNAAGHGPGTAVAGSAVTHTSGFNARSSGPHVLTSNRYFIPEIDASGGALQHATFLAVAVNAPIINSLVFNLDAERADATGNLPYASGSGCTNQSWYNLVLMQAATLTGFNTGCGSIGWTGTGTPGLPRALAFDGVDDSVAAADSDLWSFTNGAGTDSAFSVEVWFRPDSAGANNALVSKASSAANVEWALLTAGGMPVFRTYGGTTANSIGRAGTPVPSGWQQLVVTYNGSESNAGVNAYTNGALIASSPLSTGAYTGMPNTTAPLSIGVDPATGVQFAGKIAIVRLYGKELTAAEILQNCRAEAERFGVTCP